MISSLGRGIILVLDVEQGSSMFVNRVFGLHGSYDHEVGQVAILFLYPASKKNSLLIPVDKVRNDFEVCRILVD
jgi:hypothetical protein